MLIPLGQRLLWIIFSQTHCLQHVEVVQPSRCVYASKTSAVLAAQLKKAWIAELPSKDPANLLVTLTSRAEIEQLTCKVIRELKLAPLSVGKSWNCRQAGQSASVAMNALCLARFFRIICILLCFRATENGSASRNVRNSTSVGYRLLYHVVKKDDVKNSRRKSKNREDFQEFILNGAKDE